MLASKPNPHQTEVQFSLMSGYTFCLRFVIYLKFSLLSNSTFQDIYIHLFIPLKHIIQTYKPGFNHEYL